MSADAFALSPVFVCDKCGRGFLAAQPHGIDQYPLWKVLSSPVEGEICGGQISVRARLKAREAGDAK